AACWNAYSKIHRWVRLLITIDSICSKPCGKLGPVICSTRPWNPGRIWFVMASQQHWSEWSRKTNLLAPNVIPGLPDLRMHITHWWLVLLRVRLAFERFALNRILVISVPSKVYTLIQRGISHLACAERVRRSRLRSRCPMACRALPKLMARRYRSDRDVRHYNAVPSQTVLTLTNSLMPCDESSRP